MHGVSNITYDEYTWLDVLKIAEEQEVIMKQIIIVREE